MKEYFKKRKGWSDSKDGYDKKEYKHQSADQVIKDREYGKRKGWGDKESVKKYKHHSGFGQPSGAKYAKRKGWSDSGDGGYQYDGKKLKYEDGGVVGLEGEAKREALISLRNQMQELSGSSLSSSLNKSNRYEDGGIVERHDDEFEGESTSAYDELSREELIKLLKNR